jgi:thiosulfate/3-mercaptopyruvate sulfurtransferase
MSFSALIEVSELACHIGQSDWLVVDCRSSITDASAGKRAYIEGHLPGAVFADLGHDLSDKSRKGQGRHPFPSDAQFSALLSQWGLAPGTQVVCYDADNGTMAARLWWMLQAVGHAAAAVLDGGIAAWHAAGGAVVTDIPQRSSTTVDVHFDLRRFMTFEEAGQLPNRPDLILVDARAGPRYRGEVEPIDPVAGHVPGAVNRPFTDNLDASGKFKSADRLYSEFIDLLQSRPPEAMAHMCGSGVTACHNLLAMHHAGLSGARLFAPSWSGWISDPARPVAREECRSGVSRDS